MRFFPEIFRPYLDIRGGGKGDIVGVAFGVGQAGGGEAVAADGDGHTLDRAGLTGRKGLDAESSGVLHGDTLLCW